MQRVILDENSDKSVENPNSRYAPEFSCVVSRLKSARNTAQIEGPEISTPNLRVVSLSVPTSFLRRRVSVFRDSNLQPRDSSFPAWVAFSCRPPHRRVLSFSNVVAPSNTHSPFDHIGIMNSNIHGNYNINSMINFPMPAIIAFSSRRMRSIPATAANTIVVTTPC